MIPAVIHLIRYVMPTLSPLGEQCDVSFRHRRNYWKISGKMSKRFSYTASFKLKVIKYAKKHGNRAAERHFGPPPTESVIRLWRQQEGKLLQMPRQKKAMRGKPPKWPEVEQEVRTWIPEQRQTGISVSTKLDIRRR